MAGQPLGAARLVFEVDDPEVLAERSKYAANVTSDQDGNFAVTLTPFRHYRVLIEKVGVGKGEVLFQPMCGVCLRFVLNREKAEMADQ